MQTSMGLSKQTACSLEMCPMESSLVTEFRERHDGTWWLILQFRTYLKGWKGLNMLTRFAQACAGIRRWCDFEIELPNKMA